MIWRFLAAAKGGNKSLKGGTNGSEERILAVLRDRRLLNIRQARTPWASGEAGRVAQIAASTCLVSRNSKHPKEAFEFKHWMLCRDNQIQQELAGGASARNSVYQDPRVLQLPYALADSQSLAVARNVIDTSPETPQIADTIETAISDVIADKKNPRQALGWAAVELNKALGSKAPL